MGRYFVRSKVLAEKFEIELQKLSRAEAKVRDRATVFPSGINAEKLKTETLKSEDRERLDIAAGRPRR